MAPWSDCVCRRDNRAICQGMIVDGTEIGVEGDSGVARIGAHQSFVAEASLSRERGVLRSGGWYISLAPGILGGHSRNSWCEVEA